MSVEVATFGTMPVRQGERAFLAMTVLGRVRASVAGHEVRIRSRKAMAVLAYLALEEGGGATRERLVGLLWSESEEEKARASLRQVVHELREVLQFAGFRGLQADRTAVVLDYNAVGSDLRDILNSVEAGGTHPLILDVPRLAETLLPGMDDLDPAFRVWLLTRRQGLHDRMVRALEPRLRQDGLARDVRRDAARAVLQLDPTHEEACRHLMQDSARDGDAIGALRRYEALWRILADDYDTEPAAATQQLVADIKLGRLDPPTPAPAPPAAPAASIPVLAEGHPPAPRLALLVEPFAGGSIGQDEAHLVQGFRYDLIARLVRFREWFVVDGPVFPPVSQTATRVSARYRISACAYQSGERVGLVLVLAEQDSGIFVWSERLELKLDGWFDAQQHILRRITVALNMHVSSARLARLSAEPDVTLEGYDGWLRCRQMLLSFSPVDWDRAFGMMEEMSARTPGFAPTFCNLAQLDNVAHIIRPGVRRDPAREQRALANARRAVELDPTDSRSQLCLGWSLAMVGRHAQAEVRMRLALELNSDDAMLLMSLALFHAFEGQHRAAEALGRQSLEATLVPTRTHWAYEVTNAFLRGDDGAALDACDRAEDVILTLQAWRAAALHNLGRQHEAEAAAERFLRTVSENWYSPGPPTSEAVTSWLLHLYPIRRSDEWERLRAGVAGAGLATEGAAHGAWHPPAAFCDADDARA